MAIFVHDTNPLFRSALSRMIESILPNERANELNLLFDFSSAASNNDTPPLLLVTEVSSVNDGSHEYLLGLKRFFPTVNIVAMTSEPLENVKEICLASGVNLIVNKNLQVHDMAVVLGDFLNKFDQTDDTIPVEVIKKVSRRQRQLLRCVNEGHSNREISQILAISEHTVKVHFWRLFKRLGVSNRTRALVVARKNGLMIDPAPKKKKEQSTAKNQFVLLK